MALSFNSIPQTNVPVVAVEFVGGAANAGLLQRYRVLALGSPSAAFDGDYAMTRVVSAARARQMFGAGSQLAEICASYFNAQTVPELWALPIARTGSEATATLECATDNPRAGEFALYVGGVRFRVQVTATDDGDSIATKIAAVVNASGQCEMSAEATGAEVVLTAKTPGASVVIPVVLNHQSDEAMPAGVTVDITTADGTGSPGLDGLASLGEEQFNIIASPYTDSASLTVIEGWLAGRWGPQQQIEGVALTADLSTDPEDTMDLAESRNSPFMSILAAGATPSSRARVIGAFAATAAAALDIDPARQLRTLPLTGIIAPLPSAHPSASVRDLLLSAGASTVVRSADGQLRLERVVTTYKENELGADDRSYMDIMSVATLGQLRYSMRNRLMLKYPRHKLADDGTRFGAGQAVATPRTIKAELIALFREWEDLGLVERADDFKASLIVERDAQDPNRLNVFMAPNLINNLMIVAAQIQTVV